LALVATEIAQSSDGCHLITVIFCGSRSVRVSDWVCHLLLIFGGGEAEQGE